MHSVVDGQAIPDRTLCLAPLGLGVDWIAQPLPLLAVTKPCDFDRLRALPDVFFDLRDEAVALWQEVESGAAEPQAGAATE